MKEKINTQKGITLIALVITIIILLILAGVALSIVFNGGIIDKSQNSVDTYEYSSQNEEDKLSDLETKFQDLYDERVSDKKEKENIYIFDFKAGNSLSDEGFSYYNNHGNYSQGDIDWTNNNDGVRLFSQYANGYSCIQSTRKIELSNISKIEVDISNYWSDINSGFLTLSVGLYDDEYLNNEFVDGLKEDLIAQMGSLDDADKKISFDTSNITGQYYLKLCATHSSEPDSYTMGAYITDIKLYHVGNTPFITKAMYKGQEENVYTYNFPINSSFADAGFGYNNTSGSDEGWTKQNNGASLTASWGNGYAVMQSLSKLDFSRIHRIRVEVTGFWANTSEGYMTLAFGANNSATLDDTFTINDIKQSADIYNNDQNSAKKVYILDFSEKTGNYYLKVLLKHSSYPGEMTMATYIKDIKIYYTGDSLFVNE